MKNKKIRAKKANESIFRLFELAKERTAYEKRYIQLIRKTAMRNRVHLPREISRSICKHCNIILIPGKTATVRIKRGATPLRIITCTECGTIKRIGFTKAKKSQTQQKNQ